MKRGRTGEAFADEETEYWVVNRHRVQWRWQWLQLRLSQLQNVQQAVVHDTADSIGSNTASGDDVVSALLKNHPVASLKLQAPLQEDIDELRQREIQKRRRQAEARRLIKPGGVALDWDKQIKVVHVEAIEQAAGFTESNREQRSKSAIVIPGIVDVLDRRRQSGVKEEEEEEEQQKQEQPDDSDEGALDEVENTDDLQYARMHMVREIQEQAVRESWGKQRKKTVIKKRGEVTAQELLYSPMLSSRLPRGSKVQNCVIPKKRAEEIEVRAQRLKDSYVKQEKEKYVRYQLHKSFSADVIKPKGKGIPVLKFKLGKKKKTGE